MFRVLFILSSIVTTVLYANPLTNWNYEIKGCESDSSCSVLIEQGNLDDLMSRHEDPELADQFRKATAPGKGKGMQGLSEGVASATGMVIGAVKSALDGMRQAAVGAGFDTFTGTLSGPSGSISFRMNLQSGAWSFWGSSEVSTDKEPGKELVPGPSQN